MRKAVPEVKEQPTYLGPTSSVTAVLIRQDQDTVTHRRKTSVRTQLESNHHKPRREASGNGERKGGSGREKEGGALGREREARIGGEPRGWV